MKSSVPPIPACVTVVIPSYNYARFLPRAIASVLGQTRGDFVIVVVDDGSTDDTWALVEPFLKADLRVHYVHQQNAGLSAARNTGISLARTDLIAFLDADDEWEPGFLERALATMTGRSPEYAVVACSKSSIDADGNSIPTPSQGAAEPREIRRDDLILRSRFAADAVLVRKEAFEQCGVFDTTLRSSEDRDMWIRIASRFRISWWPEPLIRIRRHGENMSRNSDQMRDNMRRVLAKARHDSGTDHRFLFWLKVDAYFHMQSAWMLYPEGRRLAAVREVIISIFCWPFFRDPPDLNEPVLFRLRSLIRFILAPFRPTDGIRRTLPSQTKAAG